MSLLLEFGRLAAVLNIAILGVLIWIWGRSYRQYRASHTLGLLVFAGVFLTQNMLWVFLYGFHDQFIGWFIDGDRSYQLGVSLLCGLQTAALAVLLRITWR